MADQIPPERRLRGFFLGLFLGGISSFFVGYIQWAVTARGEDSELGLIGVCAMGAFGAFSGGFVGTLFSGRSSASRPKRRLALAAVLAPILFFGVMLFVYRSFMYPSDTLPAALFWVVASAVIGALVSWVVSPASRKPNPEN
jgi:uncharacterized membrane protein YeaQ/YmgE (transglycosylase-associated protein family)